MVKYINNSTPQTNRLSMKVSEWVTDWSTLILQCVTRTQCKCFDVDDDYDVDRKWVAEQRIYSQKTFSFNGIRYRWCRFIILLIIFVENKRDRERERENDKEVSEESHER